MSARARRRSRGRRAPRARQRAWAFYSVAAADASDLQTQIDAAETRAADYGDRTQVTLSAASTYTIASATPIELGTGVRVEGNGARLQPGQVEFGILLCRGKTDVELHNLTVDGRVEDFAQSTTGITPVQITATQRAVFRNLTVENYGRITSSPVRQNTSGTGIYMAAFALGTESSYAASYMAVGPCDSITLIGCDVLDYEQVVLGEPGYSRAGILAYTDFLQSDVNDIEDFTRLLVKDCTVRAGSRSAFDFEGPGLNSARVVACVADRCRAGSAFDVDKGAIGTILEDCRVDALSPGGDRSGAFVDSVITAYRVGGHNLSDSPGDLVYASQNTVLRRCSADAYVTRDWQFGTETLNAQNCGVRLAACDGTQLVSVDVDGICPYGVNLRTWATNLSIDADSEIEGTTAGLNYVKYNDERAVSWTDLTGASVALLGTLP